MIDAKTLDELEHAYQRAKDLNTAFNDALKAQAEKHDIDQQALGKFVRARVNDKMQKFQAEQDTMEQLSMTFHVEQRDAA